MRRAVDFFPADFLAVSYAQILLSNRRAAASCPRLFGICGGGVTDGKVAGEIKISTRT
jgi:hypothetical protein